MSARNQVDPTHMTNFVAGSFQSIVPPAGGGRCVRVAVGVCGSVPSRGCSQRLRLRVIRRLIDELLNEAGLTCDITANTLYAELPYYGQYVDAINALGFTTDED